MEMIAYSLSPRKKSTMENIDRNRLSDQPSAYLRQHSDNPVHWQPWGKEALEAAQRQNKPILLSIGYAACHWCHVMAHESFENDEIAAVMNGLFINVKVDREERPDIDQIYMAALGAMGQQGGWPLTMFLRPDGKPFWGGTYFPPAPRHGMPGFTDVLYAIHNLWQNDQEKINHNSSAIFDHLQQRLASHSGTTGYSSAQFERIAATLYQRMDPVRGGSSGAPKFPNAPLLEMLWLSWLYQEEASHRDAFLLTLRAMLQGGIYDQLGGGMCRYSTDAEWLAPHFEKMLYDNAFLIRHANWAFAETGEALFRLRIEQTIDWMLREMRLSDGSFASSLDADSEGEEGKFYVWSEAEIDQLLGPDSSDFKLYYGVRPGGNWEGHTILNRLHALHATAELPDAIKRSSQVLLQHRAQRIRPGRDDKALTDWNGFAIRALAEAGRSLERPDWIAAAMTAYQSVLAGKQDGRLAHCQMDGVKVYPALSSDYAAIINASLTLYEVTGARSYVQEALDLKQSLDRWHRDDMGSYRLTASDADDVILRSFGDQDEAIASATSQIIEALTRLSLAGDQLELPAEIATITSQALGRGLNLQYGQIGIMNAVRVASDPYSLVLVCPDFTHELVRMAGSTPDPRRLDSALILTPGAEIALPGGGSAKPDHATAWLCKGNHCLPPVQDACSLRELLVAGA